ncbi:NAD(P)/FAD-dependent oxidoreductase [Geobacter sp. DSM 9736]|uniref:NAD(P)/FAD-dependent oxidoreductase n=1 Tax=Geobacter sp. DSM 9736 TaxID=1277350 RepID=UPI000B5FDB12|nr:FAD-dependent oxidoreductase [Geobacter sp. DSM 9736]SNB47346.1 nitrite reductase (NADH) large subunit [Geobacter sp. DSM 9736]
MMKVVTVGTGMAAAEFVQRLRFEGFSGEITMMGDEDFPPYSPCVIPFYLAGEPMETVYWKGSDFYERYRVTARLGDPVVEVDPERHLVRSAGGHCETYDRLFFATGARSWYPRPEWLDTHGVFGFKTLSDMVAIDHYIRENSVTEVVVFGGGFIGVDAALALRHRGLRVVLVHRNTRVLSQMTDEEGGLFATARLREKTGIDIRLKTMVEGIVSCNGALKAVTLSTGESMETSLLILAIGVSPNSEPLSGNDKGIAGNAQMMADPSIYAAGDVAVTTHAVSGATGIYATYPNAMLQARTAARHLVHGEGCYLGSINTNILRKHIEFPIVSAGSFNGEAVTWTRGDIWRRVYLTDGMINGYLVIGDMRMSGYLYQLYVARKRVDRTIRQVLFSPTHDGYYREMLGIEPLSRHDQA